MRLVRVWRLFSDLDLSDAQNDAIPQPARVLHPGAAGTAPARSSPIPRSSLVPATRSSARTGRSTAPRSSRSRVRPTAWSISCPIAMRRARIAGGAYVTLRLTAGMYHRFHAPHDCRVESVTYISGDTWNVNPDRAEAHRGAVLQERARRGPHKAGCERPRGDLGAGRGHPRCGSSLPLSQPWPRSSLRRAAHNLCATPRFGRARNWAGSSMARRSWCSRRRASSCAGTSRRARGYGSARR